MWTTGKNSFAELGMTLPGVVFRGGKFDRAAPESESEPETEREEAKQKPEPEPEPEPEAEPEQAPEPEQEALRGTDFGDRAVPSRVSSLARHRVVRVAAGQHHVVALADSGAVFTWGAAGHGQCGRSLAEARVAAGLLCAPRARSLASRVHPLLLLLCRFAVLSRARGLGYAARVCSRLAVVHRLIA